MKSSEFASSGMIAVGALTGLLAWYVGEALFAGVFGMILVGIGLILWVDGWAKRRLLKALHLELELRAKA